MNTADFKALLIPPNSPLHEALRRLDSSGRGLLMVVDADGRLQRTVTDGDLRRPRLQGLPDDTLLGALPAQRPMW